MLRPLLPFLWTEPASRSLLAGVLRDVDQRLADDDPDGALDCIESAWPGLPEQTFDPSLIEPLTLKAYLRVQLGRLEDALAVFEAISRCGASANLSSPAYSALRALPGYEDLVRRNEALLTRERSEARVVLDVQVPPELRGNHVAPLLLLLHGEPGSLARMRDDWPTDAILARGMIAAYVQSSQLRSTHRYVWSADPAVARADVAAAYHETCRRYAIEGAQTIVGGFSAGATAALDALFSDTVPATGFVCLCVGGKPESFTLAAARAAAARGVRGVFFEGEQNGVDEEESAMLEVLKQAGVETRLVMNPGVAHEAPPDFAERIGRALDFVLGREGGV